MITLPLLKSSLFQVAIVGGLLAVHHPAQAQAVSQEIPPPKFPITLRAPEKSAWTIDVKESGSTSSSNKNEDPYPVVTQLAVTKTFPVYEEKAMVKNGKSWNRWIFVTDRNTYRLVQYAGAPGWERVPETYYGEVSRYENSDFEDLSWINEKNYKGVEMLDSRPTYAFELIGSAPITRRDREFFDAGDTTRKETFVARAWLDAKTLLPIKFEDNREVRTFSFAQAPASQLTPPTVVMTELKKWVEEIRRINR